MLQVIEVNQQNEKDECFRYNVFDESIRRDCSVRKIQRQWRRREAFRLRTKMNARAFFLTVRDTMNQTHKNRPDDKCSFDPVQMNDPLAMKVSWEPLPGRGKAFKLVSDNPNYQEFQLPLAEKIFLSVPCVIGLAFVFLCYAGAMLNGSIWETHTLQVMLGLLFVTFVGGFIVWAGIKYFKKENIPVVFDFSSGIFWKGHDAPDEVTSLRDSPIFEEIVSGTITLEPGVRFAITSVSEQSKEMNADDNRIRRTRIFDDSTAFRLEDIHALQLLKKKVKRHKNRIVVIRFELNLIMNTSMRLNLVEDISPDSMRKDARKLAAALGVPVWDAIS